MVVADVDGNGVSALDTASTFMEERRGEKHHGFAALKSDEMPGSIMEASFMAIQEPYGCTTRS